MISIKQLSVSYPNKNVLQNISIDFESNQIYGIVGLNGAGKTTFFNALSSDLRVNSGELYFNGRPITNLDIAYLETVNFFYSKITGNEYLKIFKQANEKFDLNALQELFQLPLDELIETYSTGMKKKLALLAILKQDKPVFLLDEPFNGLDLETNKIVELIIITLKEKGKTIFLSSHIIDPLLTICDEIHFLEEGKFIKKFNKSNFDKLEEELFRKLKTEAKSVIATSL